MVNSSFASLKEHTSRLKARSTFTLRVHHLRMYSPHHVDKAARSVRSWSEQQVDAPAETRLSRSSRISCLGRQFPRLRLLDRSSIDDSSCIVRHSRYTVSISVLCRVVSSCSVVSRIPSPRRRGAYWARSVRTVYTRRGPVPGEDSSLRNSERKRERERVTDRRLSSRLPHTAVVAP